MKLKNKKTGEIVYATMMASYGGGELQIRYYPVNNAEDTQFKEYRSISELNEEWEDYEEPKNPYFINWFGEVSELSGYISDKEIKRLKEIGNYFETKEEAEKAVEKLKAWKRLKDKGFSFNDWDWKYQNIGYNLDCTAISEEDVIEAEKDLDLLFGGEK